mmetsp:Transcript_44037/g.94363  ORF Transcript_44037/g.94363 Transcript_44037/m.94363 type:complete len:233 (-) Transcript_44037:359-1057(-)
MANTTTATAAHIGSVPTPQRPNSARSATAAAAAAAAGTKEVGLEEKQDYQQQHEVESAASEALNWPAETTTVMLRNIPNRYTAEELLAEMIAAGFEDTFDFFYLPIDFKTKRNRGYSFINFFSAHWAAQFVKAFDGERLTRYSTLKILEVSPAVTQGFEANVARYVRKDAQRIKNAWFRPMVFPKGGAEGSNNYEDDDEEEEEEEYEEAPEQGTHMEKTAASEPAENPHRLQ